MKNITVALTDPFTAGNDDKPALDCQAAADGHWRSAANAVRLKQ